MMDFLIVIPARGGSKGIPRKCLRPLAGKPMLYYAVKTALNTPAKRVVVSTDDPEIAMFAERFGASVLSRPSALADDIATLDPVISHAATTAEATFREKYQAIITVQPTSPLISVADITSAVAKLSTGECDSAISVVEDKHLSWTIENGVPVPIYEKRVNRQLLPPRFRETGAVIGCTREQIETGTRIGTRVELIEIPQSRSFDIDSHEDLFLCESVIGRKRIVFTVIGYAEVGLGHAYRALMIAHELVHHDIIFMCERRSELAAKVIRARNYRTVTVEDGGLLPAVINEEPDLVINDILDTTREYITALKTRGIAVINFEDLGPGKLFADSVVNALYPVSESSGNIVTGPDYFWLRDEFVYGNPVRTRDRVKQILITFGGVDEGNLTLRACREIREDVEAANIKVDVVLGPGNRNKEAVAKEIGEWTQGCFEVVLSTNRISDYMQKADLAITSGGRTVLELVAMQVPTIVICQNERECAHMGAAQSLGVVNMGLHSLVCAGGIHKAFAELMHGSILRKTLIATMKCCDLRSGKARVLNIIKSLLSRNEKD